MKLFEGWQLKLLITALATMAWAWVLPAPAAEEDDDAPRIDLPPAIKNPPAPFAGEGWEMLFTGHGLNGWGITKFVGRNAVLVKSGVILMHMGDPFTGVNYTNDFPKMNYEVAFDAMRVMGNDFFCGLTLPFQTNHFSLVVGGWGGGVVGISSINGMDASENETTRFMSFETGKWYRIRVRVTKDRIEAWIDDKKTADVVTKDKRISPRPGEIEKSIPFGIACWQTAAAVREIKWRPIETPADPPKKHDW